MKQVSKEINQLVYKLTEKCQKDGWDLSLYISDVYNNPPKRKYMESLFHLISGLYYGHPICCILFFIKNKNSLIELNRLRGDLFHYVPCNRHYKKNILRRNKHEP